MGDYVDELNNVMPAPGNGRPKRARIDKEGNFVAGGNVYAYNTVISPPIRYNISSDSIKKWGAVGDGVTDDTNAIVLALANVDCIYFPSGTYLVTSALAISTGKKIEGCNATINSTATPVLTLNNSSQVTGINFTYTGADAANGTGVVFSGTTGRLQNCTVTAPKGAVVSSGASRLVDCTFTSTVQNLKLETGAFQSVIDSCKFFITGAIVVTSMVELDGCDDNSFNNCVWQSSNGATATHGVLLNVNASNNYIQAADFRSTTGTITNRITDNGNSNIVIAATFTNSAMISTTQLALNTVAGPTITAGAGPPASTPPNGSVYFRTNAATADEALYMRIGGAWVALDGAP